MKNNLLLTSCLVVGIAAAMPDNAQAADLWVSDVLYTTLREGKSEQNPIIKDGLKSGTALTKIEEDTGTGWVLVATEQGEKGWIQRKYLSDEPTALIRLNKLQNNLTLIEKQRKPADEQVKKLTTENQALREELNRITAENNQVTTELNTIKKSTGNIVDVSERYQSLMREHQLMLTEMDVVKAENSRLSSNDRNTFFIYGTGAVGLGVLITLIVPSLRRRKRFSDWA